MESRLLVAALWRRRGTALLAVVAVAIGAAVTSALIHVSRDVGHKVTRELRALGPNLLLVPGDPISAARSGPAPRGPAETAHVPRSVYLDQAMVTTRLDRAGLVGVPLLYALVSVEGRPVNVVGADLAAARELHPSWKIASAGGSPTGSFVGARLMKRLGVRSGQPLSLVFPATGRRLELPAGSALEAGGPDDETWWIPLADLQALTGLEGRVSLAQARVEGDPARVASTVAALQDGGGMRAVVLHALTATEAELLDRTRRLMGLVTLAVLIAAGLCAFGTLTDLALERRREVALLKALGASRRDLMRLFGAESAAVGLLGGIGGWLAGLVLAQLIGREVFHASIRIQWSAAPMVLGLSLLVALVASAGPVRLALAVDPAPVLKGE